MKSTRIVTRAGTFKIVLAAKGPRNATREDVAHALAIALNRVIRSERRQTLLRMRRAKAGKR